MGRVTRREAERATEIARGDRGVEKVVRVFEIVSEAELAGQRSRAARRRAGLALERAAAADGAAAAAGSQPPRSGRATPVDGDQHRGPLPAAVLPCFSAGA